MDGWDLGLLVIASYVAVSSLVRLMRERRDVLAADMRRQLEAEKRRLAAEDRQAKEKARREKKKAA